MTQRGRSFTHLAIALQNDDRHCLGMSEISSDHHFLRWLVGLEPREELIVRMAVFDYLGDSATAKEWDARIDALLDELKPDEAELAEIFRTAELAAREIL